MQRSKLLDNFTWAKSVKFFLLDYQKYMLKAPTFPLDPKQADYQNVINKKSINKLMLF